MSKFRKLRLSIKINKLEFFTFKKSSLPSSFPPFHLDLPRIAVALLPPPAPQMSCADSSAMLKSFGVDAWFCGQFLLTTISRRKTRETWLHFDEMPLIPAVRCIFCSYDCRRSAKPVLRVRRAPWKKPVSSHNGRRAALKPKQLTIDAKMSKNLISIK